MGGWGGDFPSGVKKTRGGGKEKGGLGRMGRATVGERLQKRSVWRAVYPGVHGKGATYADRGTGNVKNYRRQDQGEGG